MPTKCAPETLHIRVAKSAGRIPGRMGSWNKNDWNRLELCKMTPKWLVHGMVIGFTTLSILSTKNGWAKTSAIVRRLFNLLKMLDINWCMLEKSKYYPHATGLGHGETCQARHRAVVATLCITARIIMVSIIFTLGHGIFYHGYKKTMVFFDHGFLRYQRLGHYHHILPWTKLRGNLWQTALK